MGDARPSSRRALLTAAASGAAAIAANAAMSPAIVRGADVPLLLNVDNSGVARTSLTTSVADAAMAVTNPDAGGTGVRGSGAVGVAGSSALYGGTGVAASATDYAGTGVSGWTTGSKGRGVVAGSMSPDGTGVFGTAGDPTFGPSEAPLTGVFGFAVEGDGQTTMGTGVWGHSPDVGVYGSGGTGVVGDGGTSGWGLYGYSKSSYGLYVSGKVMFATRSGRTAVAKGKTSWTKSTGLAGVTSSNIVIAVLQTPESGTWVRAAVAATGKITVYFNRALPSSSSVGWLILG